MSVKSALPLILKRNRLVYFLSTLGVIALGLGSRKFSSFFPELINTYLGDALWALMIYFMAATVFKSKTIITISVASLLFCYAIELSQLYHEPWIDSIRSTTPGGLVLGFGFLWTDMLAYTIGIVFGACIEWIIYYTNRHT
ncbi:MAG: DUF2809 domain-containing protein [Paludibacter sp.]|jgi:hypothetical protein|nr:DUF2809 domain-containing protein [Paludibacter sp.]